MEDKVGTITEFVSLVEDVCSLWGTLDSTTHPWFRGQQMAKWPLVPGLYRGRIDPVREREILRDFKLKAVPFLNQHPGNDLEWLFVMQHYGMPTRLLDWTESYLYALYFAVSSYEKRSDACVWILDPWSLNKTSLGIESVPTAEEESLGGYWPTKGGKALEASSAAAIRPTYSTARITAQKGVFTIHGSSTEGLEQQAIHSTKKSEGLFRVLIRGTAKKSMLRELHRSGVTASSVFPDLSGLCTELAFRYSKAYIGSHRRTKRKLNSKTAKRENPEKKVWTKDDLPTMLTGRKSSGKKGKRHVDSERRSRPPRERISSETADFT